MSKQDSTCETCAARKQQAKKDWHKKEPCQGCGWDADGAKNRNWRSKDGVQRASTGTT